jgi:hypothetical protein
LADSSDITLSSQVESIMIINSKFGSNFLSEEEKMLENIYDAL